MNTVFTADKIAELVKLSSSAHAGFRYEVDQDGGWVALESGHWQQPYNPILVICAACSGERLRKALTRVLIPPVNEIAFLYSDRTEYFHLDSGVAETA